MATKQRRVTRDVGPLSLRASVAPATLDEEKRTVDVVWTTGAPVMRGFFDRFWEELSLDPKHVRMERLNNGAPLLDTHDDVSLRSVLGVVERARIEGGKGIATIRFARDEAGSAVLAKVKDGIIRNVSVGYRVHRMEKVSEGDAEIPTFRATDWEPHELSMVPIGADAGAAVRGATEHNICEFIEEKTMPTKTRAEDGEEIRDDEPTATAEDEKSEGDEGEATEPAIADADDKRAAVVMGERQRVLEIQSVGKTLELPPTLAAQHVKRGTSAAGFRKLALVEYEKAKRIDPGAGADMERKPRIVAGEDARDKLIRGAKAWLFVRSGFDRMVIEHAKKRGETLHLDPGEFRGMSMVELASHCLERMGVNTRGMSKMDRVGKALTHRAGGYQTTSDFPALLEGAANTILLAAYETADDAWRTFCRVGSVADFRPHYRMRMGTFGRLDKVNEHGEFKNKPIPDGAAESIAAETFGNIIGITRQALINDDLGAFNSLSSDFGMSAANSIEIDVFAELALNAGLGPVMADGLTLFHVTHGNISTGSALSVAGLDADLLAMALQKDSSGNRYLKVMPKVLLVPVGEQSQAQQMVDAQYDVTAGTANQTPNRIRGRFPVIVGSPYLTGTRRYVFADPARFPTFEVVFLDGQQQPFLESQEGWRIDGIEWKCRLDYGVGAVDYRGALTNAGV